MEYQNHNEITPISIEKGKSLIALVIGLFLLEEIISIFIGGFSLGRIFIGSLLLFLIYEGYNWARILFGIISIIGTFFGAIGIILVISGNFSWITMLGLILALTLSTLSSLVISSILFFSKNALAFLKIREKEPKYKISKTQERPNQLSQNHELGEKIRLHFEKELPSYQITTLLAIPNTDEQIVLMNYTENFRNVFRCQPDGSVVWQAKLPTDSDDVYTDIEWKDEQLTAFSRSCISVILDVTTGEILFPKVV